MAKQSKGAGRCLDRRVASLLAMTIPPDPPALLNLEPGRARLNVLGRRNFRVGEWTRFPPKADRQPCSTSARPRRTLDMVGPAQFVFFSSGAPALRRPSTMRRYCALKVGSSLQCVPAKVCTVKPG